MSPTVASFPSLQPATRDRLPPGEGRIQQLDGFRALAFASVFVWHSARIPYFVPLWMGVDMFFVLSGFLITGILLNERQKRAKMFFGRFYSRRALRILPPYVIATVFAAAFFVINWRGAWPWYVFFSSNVGQYLGAVPAPMTTFWSLAVEEQFYLLWPLVIFYLSPKAVFRTAVAGVLLVPCARFLFSHWLGKSEAIFLLTPFRADLLLAGAILAFLWRNDRTIVLRRPRAPMLAIALAVTLFVALTLISPSFQRDSGSRLFDTAGYSIVLLFSAAFLVQALIARPDSLLYRFLTNRVVTYLGRISYMMYLIHSTCIMASVKYLNQYGPLVSRGFALAATIGISALSWHWIESKIQKPGAPRSIATQPI